MSFKIDIDPLEALEIFYKGEKLGAWEGDFIKNEKKRGLKLPKLLKDFLANYGLLSVNSGMNQLWLPDKIDPDTAKVDGEMCNVLIIGKFRNNLVAIRADKCSQDNPTLLLDDLPEENNDEITLVFHEADLYLREYLLIMLIESPSVYNNAQVYDGEDAQKVLDELSDKSKLRLKKLIHDSKRPGRYVCWDESERYFVAVISMDEHTVLLKFEPSLTIQELENIFTREFYENADNCDYEHALNILRLLIDYWIRIDKASAILADKYKLAGRCCWALKCWGEAEYYYNQAEQFYRDVLIEAVEKSAAFYEGLSNFYLDREDIYKSEAACREVDRLCEFSGNNGPRRKGERIMRQGMIMAEATRYEKAIELYDQALAEYQKDPKNCKYDIARCQQLRGEAKKLLKEKSK